MLVLSRKIGEKIAIGEDVVVVVRSIRPTRVSLGIAAPDEVTVLRGELVGGEDPRGREDEKDDAERG